MRKAVYIRAKTKEKGENPVHESIHISPQIFVHNLVKSAHLFADGGIQDQSGGACVVSFASVHMCVLVWDFITHLDVGGVRVSVKICNLFSRYLGAKFGYKKSRMQVV